MKTKLDIYELIELDACRDGSAEFYLAYGDKDVKFSEALGSNGWDDVWWYLDKAWDKLSQSQQDDIGLLGCDWAEKCLHRFESACPNDNRPRLAIEAKRKFIRGEIGVKELRTARSAALSASRSAARAAESAALSAESAAESASRSAESTWSAAESAALSATWSAESTWPAAMREMEADLRKLFVKWESEQ